MIDYLEVQWKLMKERILLTIQEVMSWYFPLYYIQFRLRYPQQSNKNHRYKSTFTRLQNILLFDSKIVGCKASERKRKRENVCGCLYTKCQITTSFWRKTQIDWSVCLTKTIRQIISWQWIVTSIEKLFTNRLSEWTIVPTRWIATQLMKVKRILSIVFNERKFGFTKKICTSWQTSPTQTPQKDGLEMTGSKQFARVITLI